MLMILIHSASILPLLHPFVQINPANKFLHSGVQFRIQLVQTAVHQKGWGRVDEALIQMGRWMEESKLCVYLRCRRAFLGRQGSGKAPLEDQRHSQQRPEGNKIQRSGRKTRPEQSKKHKNKPSPAPPSPLGIQTLNLSEIHCLYTMVRIIHFVCEIPNRSSWERTMVAGAACESHRNNSMYNKHSHRKSKKSAPRIIPERKFQKQHSAQEEEERYGSPLPRFSFQTIKGTPDWPLGSTFPAVPPSIHKCCRQEASHSPKQQKKGKVKVWFLKKCHFHHFFSSSSFF